MAKEHISSLSTKEPVTGVHDKLVASPYEQMETHDSAAPLQGDIVSTSKIDDWWVWELLGVLGSALAISGLCILLKKFDGRPLPRWSHTYQGKIARFRDKTAHITLNSIIEAISIAARLCLLIPITKGLSQLKWVWFAEKERTLTDLRYFEAASRQSLLDSIKLIWGLKARHFAVMGALAVIAAQGFSFFTQNLVTYPIMYCPDSKLHKPLPPNADQLYANWAESLNNSSSVPPLPPELQTARIANATTYQAVSPRNAPYYNVDPEMKANIWAAIYATDPYGAWSTASYYCSTGNCTWEGYSSLGVCSRCSDLTSKLTKNCVPKPGIDPPGVTGCDVSLPNGFSLGGVEGSRYNLMAMNTSFQPLVYTNYTSPIAVVQSITAYDTFFVNSTTPINASECALIPCVLNYTNSTTNSSPILKGVGYNAILFLEYVDAMWDSYTFDSNQQSPLNGPTINVALNTSRNDTTKFFIDQGTYLGLKHYTNALLNGFVRGDVTENLSFLSDNRTQNVTASSQDAMQAIYQPCLGYDIYGNPVLDWAACGMTFLALGMTKIIRDKSFNLTSNSAIGETLAGQQIVTVSWIWIIPAVGLWLLSITTLIGTAWRTRRTRVKKWRGNPLALVFLGLGRKELEEVKQHGLTEDGLVKKAEALKVQLRFTDRQAELVHA